MYCRNINYAETSKYRSTKAKKKNNNGSVKKVFDSRKRLKASFILKLNDVFKAFIAFKRF